MGLPDIVIEFSKKAVTAIKNGTTGVVGLIVYESTREGVTILNRVEDIPTGTSAFSEENTTFIRNAFLGAPSKVIVYAIRNKMNAVNDSATPHYLNKAITFFSTQKVNYIASNAFEVSAEIIDAHNNVIIAGVKSIRANTSCRPVAVVSSYGSLAMGDRSAVNFVVLYTDDSAGFDVTKDPTALYCLCANGEPVHTYAYTSRMAGLLAGLDLKVSATYKPLDEVTSIPVVTPEMVNSAVDRGALVLYNNGEKIVIARGVNTLTTVNETETEDLKKIKISAIQDMIETDIYSTINNSYIGNYSNSYDNKCLLITAIRGYLRGLEAVEGGKGYLKANSSNIEINVAKQRQYLESIGIDTSEMDEQAIKEANTGSHVFLKGTISILDAIEDVEIFINKE